MQPYNWDRNLASSLEAVGIACLVVSPGSHFPQHGWVQFLLGLAWVSFFSQEAGLLDSEVSGLTKLARSGRSLAGTVQRHTWGGGRAPALLISLQSTQPRLPEAATSTQMQPCEGQVLGNLGGCRLAPHHDNLPEHI